MNIKEAADDIRSTLGMLKRERAGLADRITEMLEQRYNSLSPIFEIMKAHEIPFRNSLVEGSSDIGLVIGEENIGDDRRLFVFDGLYVRMIDTKTGRIADDPISMADFIKTADLECVRAGFDYVHDLKGTAVKEYAERNRVLKGFLQENE